MYAYESKDYPCIGFLSQASRGYSNQTGLNLFKPVTVLNRNEEVIALVVKNGVIDTSIRQSILILEHTITKNKYPLVQSAILVANMFPQYKIPENFPIGTYFVQSQILLGSKEAKRGGSYYKIITIK